MGSFRHFRGHLATGIPGIEVPGRFKQQNLRHLARKGKMLNPPGHHQKFNFFQPYNSIG